MHAVIHRSEKAFGAGMMPVAGKPLIARQLQWLRAWGHGPVAVELGTDSTSDEIARWLQEEDAIGVGVTLVTSRRALTPRELARRAGFSEDVSLLAVPEDVVILGDLGPALDAAGERGALIRAFAPGALDGALEGAELSIVSGAGDDIEVSITAEGGNAVRVRTPADALSLSVAALRGDLGDGASAARGILIHAAEVEPGIWMGRGVLVEPGAVLRAPLLLGAHSVVCRGAEVGPSVCVGNRAVIEAETKVRSSLIRAGTIVGEELCLDGLAVDPEGVIDLSTGARTLVCDSLILASRDAGRMVELSPLVLEIVVLVVVTPLTLLVQLVTLAFAGAREAFPLEIGRGSDPGYDPALIELS
ncbi:MAG: hypothetical protein U0359_01435 [Byssovorax sp.]